MEKFVDAMFTWLTTPWMWAVTLVIIMILGFIFLKVKKFFK